MKFRNSVLLGLFVLLINLGCGETKKQEVPNAETVVTEEVDVSAIKAAKIKEDSLMRAKEADSIKQDSLRQVKEHGHAH